MPNGHFVIVLESGLRKESSFGRAEQNTRSPALFGFATLMSNSKSGRYTSAASAILSSLTPNGAHLKSSLPVRIGITTFGGSSTPGRRTLRRSRFTIGSKLPLATRLAEGLCPGIYGSIPQGQLI